MKVPHPRGLWRLSGLLLLAVSGILSGCAVAPAIDAAPEKLSAIRSITIIRPIEPETYFVTGQHHVSAGLGAFLLGPLGAIAGGAVADIQRANHQRTLTIGLRAQEVSITRQLADEVASNLSAFGFVTNVEDWPWEKPTGAGELPVEKVNSSADAVLILQPIFIGFNSSGPLSDYTPSINVYARLVIRTSGEKLYSRGHSGGSLKMPGDPKVIKVTKGFATADDLLSDSKQAAAQLSEVCSLIATSIAEDLRPH
jgi:hypothetical protein